jgi:hypothetical protein
MCQEVGHTFGLNHQDEVFTNENLGSCMDYTDDPDGSIGGEASNLHPNDHDYNELTQIYAHLNSTDSDSDSDGGGNGNGKGGGRKPNKSDTGVDRSPNSAGQWGRAISQDARGRNSIFERINANGQVIITHVLWAI